MKLRPEDLKWCVRRLPRDLTECAVEHKEKLIIAGGFIRSCITNEPISDIDVFVSDAKFAKMLAEDISGGRYFETDNAYTVLGVTPTVQIIHRWLFNTAVEVVQSFDFTIASAAIWHDGKDWHSVCDERYYADLAAKRLVYRQPVRNEDAGGSLLRVLKFYQRGYRIPLDSLGMVLARLTSAVKWTEIDTEQKAASVLSGLLFEVDPNAIPVVFADTKED